MNNRHITKLWLAFSATFLISLFRMCGGIGDENWDGYFGVPGANGAVYALTVTPSGSIGYCAGSFSQVGGIWATNVAFWNGTNWAALAEGVNGGLNIAYVLAVRGNSLYVAGNFSKAGGINATNIAQWDGTNWASLSGGLLSDSFHGGVYALGFLGLNLYVGGNFTNAGGLKVSNLARWTSTGW